MNSYTSRDERRYYLFLAKTSAQGSTGFLDDNIVTRQCHKIAVVLNHYRVVKVLCCRNQSMFEGICNHRMNTLFHARFKQVVQLI